MLWYPSLTTSHISVLVLHHTQNIRGTNCRLYFTAGERCIAVCSAAIANQRAVPQLLSSETSEVVERVSKLLESGADLRRKQKKLLMEIAKMEGDRVSLILRSGKYAIVHRVDDGLEFINMVVSEIKDVVKETNGIIVLPLGREKQAVKSLL
jgi:misacylated tRNA(Ala) deacylase